MWKKEKDKTDLQILDQLESSTAYFSLQNQQNQFLNLQDLNPSSYDELEKIYILDICFLAIWNDKVLDTSEYSFLIELVKSLQLSEDGIEENISVIKEFSKKHSKSIKLFESINPLNQLYKQASATVKVLIIRNKNRLIEELVESRELSSDEKDKVKDQLLDICKSVPSLTIFLIPGGGLLLPLLVKYIPSLLPSAFNENKIDIKNK
ncbi:MAG: LETM1 domain-containing protein [Flavobacteriales bacterium]